MPEADARRVLDRYADAGGNVVDTANFYGDGHSERVVGELLAGRRDRFVLATKYTVNRDPTDPNAAGNHRKNLVQQLDVTVARSPRIALSPGLPPSARPTRRLRLSPPPSAVRRVEDGAAVAVRVTSSTSAVVVGHRRVDRGHDYPAPEGHRPPAERLRHLLPGTAMYADVPRRKTRETQNGTDEHLPHFVVKCPRGDLNPHAP
nr:aldo/keto reductase [Actinomadura mexicana]